MPHATPQELVNGCQGLVRSIAWKIHQKVLRHVDLDDLIGYGQVGLVEAARDFDPELGHQFTTYAYHRVRGAILDGLSTMSWFRRADYHRGRYEAGASDIVESSMQETRSDLDWFRSTANSLCGSFIVSQLSPEVHETPDQRSEISPSDQLVATEVADRVVSLISTLEEQEHTLIRRVYFDGWSIKRAGEELGISKAWASRIHSRTLERLALQLSQCE